MPITDDLSRLGGRGGAVIKLGELMMILDLHRQRHLSGGKVNIGIGISGAPALAELGPTSLSARLARLMYNRELQGPLLVYDLGIRIN